VAALRRLGFAKVYDTTFTADLTVWEEGAEFVRRLRSADQGPLPMMTSCCPAWVKWVEQFSPASLPHLSTCRSPQGMFGGLARRLLPGQLGVDAARLAVVSIMPCTAKKAEAAREELRSDGRREIDHVLTTEELARMIEAAGIRLADLAPEDFDQPFGMKTGRAAVRRLGRGGGGGAALRRRGAGRRHAARRGVGGGAWRRRPACGQRRYRRPYHPGGGGQRPAQRRPGA
jgi:iron only hydrogenase large subunit-like protein